MFENETKGWHGSYSLMGKISAESFPMVLNKEKILKGLYKPKKIKDYFNTEDDIDEIDSDSEDIFDIKYKMPSNIKKNQLKICEPNTKKPIPEKYKYHHIHHKELYNLMKILKTQTTQCSTIYDPKKEYIWPKTYSPPQWDNSSGREKGGLFNIKIDDINNNTININKLSRNKNDLKNNKNFRTNKKYKTMSNFYDPKKAVDMNKFGKRTSLETHHDLRIRIFRPFMKKRGEKTIRIQNFLKRMELENKYKYYKKLNKNKNKNFYIIEENNILEEDNDELYNNTYTKNFRKKKSRNNNTNQNIIHTINFSKTLPREKFSHISRNNEGIRPFFSPKYTLVEPRSLTMISYSKKQKIKSPSRRRDNQNISIFINADKCLNKANPHVLLFKNFKDIQNEKLPTHMNDIFNRQSLETITDKTLKMNNFSKSEKNFDYTTFCTKKSHNKMINIELLKIEGKNEMNDMKKFSKILLNKNIIKKNMEFYLKNLDDNKINYTGKNFDKITLKSIEPIGNLTDKDKELFSLNFSK